MATNDLQAVVGRNLVSATEKFENQIQTLRLASFDRQSEFSTGKERIDVPLDASVVTDHDIVEAREAPANEDNRTNETRPLRIEQKKESAFLISSSDIETTDAVITPVADGLADAQAHQVNLMETYAVEVAKNQCPHSLATLSGANLSAGLRLEPDDVLKQFGNAELRQTLSKVGPNERRMIASPRRNAITVQNKSFLDVSQSASPEALRNGFVARALGFDLYPLTSTYRHTAGTAASVNLSTAANAAVGDKEIRVTAASACVLNAGDRFTIDDGGTKIYSVAEQVNFTGGNLTQVVKVNGRGGLTTAAASGKRLRVAGDFAFSLVFPPRALWLVTIGDRTPAGGGGPAVDEISDTRSGVSVTRKARVLHNQTRFSVESKIGGLLAYPDQTIVLMEPISEEI